MRAEDRSMVKILKVANPSGILHQQMDPHWVENTVWVSLSKPGSVFVIFCSVKQCCFKNYSYFGIDQDI